MSRVYAMFALLLLAAPAAAQQPAFRWSPEDTEEWREAQRYAEEGADKLRQSLQALLQAMPYGLPHLDADGNIVIPRQHPHAGKPGRRERDST